MYREGAMPAHRAADRRHKSSGYYVQLASLDTSEGGLWSFQLQREFLTLQRPDGTSVLQLHRDEAPRYLRFRHSLVRGGIVSLTVVEGLKDYSFRCDRAQRSKLLSWLPQKKEKERRAEVRVAAAAVALFGATHVLLYQYLYWPWGILLLAAGVLGLARPERAQYLINGFALSFAGSWGLIPQSTVGVDPRSIPPEARLIPFVVCSVLLLWGIQQFSMLGPNHHLRVARAVRDRRLAFLPRTSPLARRLSVWSMCGAAVFGIYALGLILTVLLGTSAPDSVGRLLAVGTDLAVYGGGASVIGVLAWWLRRSRQAPYLEAKMAGQLMIALALLTVYGVSMTLATSSPLTLWGRVLTLRPDLFTQPYVWALVILTVLLFNRWFSRLMDRELEEQRE
jgi:hypothetical protein